MVEEENCCAMQDVVGEGPKDAALSQGDEYRVVSRGVTMMAHASRIGRHDGVAPSHRGVMKVES